MTQSNTIFSVPGVYIVYYTLPLTLIFLILPGSFLNSSSSSSIVFETV